MSEFTTPQRVTVDGKENATSTHHFDHFLSKVDGKVLKPTGKVPLGLIFDTNRGMLQSGAQRVLVKEKDLKPMKVISTSKTNFMKPTEAFSNGHVSTPGSKQSNQKPSSIGKYSSTPTSITHMHSANGKQRLASKRSLKADNTSSTPLTTTRNNRSSSTPPSAKRPVALHNQPSPHSKPSSGGGSAGYAVPKSREYDSISLRAKVMESPARSSHSATILFSPSSADKHHVDDSDAPKAAQRRAVSAPRSRPHFDRVGDHHHVINHLNFVVPGERLSPSIAEDKMAASPPMYDLRQQRPSSDGDRRMAKTPVPVTPSSGEKALRPSTQQQHSVLTPQSASRNVIHKAPIPTTPTAVNHTPKVHLFKNPAPSSLLVTTADTLSANKAAKKAVIASFKAPPAAHHHYSAATHSSAAAAVAAVSVLTTPSRKAKTPVTSGTPQQTVKTSLNAASSVSGDKRSAMAAAPSTPLRTNSTVQSTPDRTRPPSTPLSAAKNTTSHHQQETHSGTKQRLKKTGVSKKVTISAASPTVLNAGETHRRRDPISAHGTLRSAPLFDVDRVMDSIAASDRGDRGMHRAPVEEQRFCRDQQEMRRSMSFGSELSSVHGQGGIGDCTQTDISIADTINLSTNTSMFDIFATPNSHSFDLDTSHFQRGRGSINASKNRDALALLTLEENLMDLSAVEAQTAGNSPSGLFSTESSPSMFSSSFTPIPPAPPAAWTHVDQRVIIQQQLNKKPARHHHNTATATSRSTDLASFYAQYGSGYEGLQLVNPQVTRAYSGGIPTPIERSGSQHYLNNMSMSSMPGLSRQSSLQEDFHSSVDSGAPFRQFSTEQQDEELNQDSALDRGMLVEEDSVFTGLSVTSSSTSSHQLLNQAMTMSSAFEFSPRGSRPTSTVANSSMISQLSCSFNMSAANTPRVRTAGALEASRCSYVSSSSCPSELNRGMVQEEDVEDVEEVEEERYNTFQKADVFYLPPDAQSESIIVASDAARNTSCAVAGLVDHCEQSSISCCEDVHDRDSTFGSASSILITGQQEQRLDALVGAAAISGLVNTTCIRVNVHDVHSMDSGYALADDPMEEERGGEGGFDALNLRSSALFNDRSASSVVDDSHSDEFAGSSGDAVNMEESNSTTDSHAVHDNNVNNADDDDDDDEAFVFARRDSGEQDDTVLCQESDEIVTKTDHHENQSSRALVIVDESAILPNSWCDSHFVDEEMQSGLQCSSILPLLSGGPPRLAVSDSFELMPRSASALPVPVSHVSSTPVTKSYLDFERRNKSGGSAVKQQHHQSLFRSHSPIAMSPEETLTPVDISETEGSDASSQPFVSTLPAMSRAAAQTSESPSRPQTLRTMADESLVSVLSSSRFSSTSASSRSSCTDELRRFNPHDPSSSEQWASAHYGHLHGGASCFLGNEEDGGSRLLHTIRSADGPEGESFSFDEMSLLSNREDDACCPDPLYGLLHSRDAWDEGEQGEEGENNQR